MKTEYKSNRVFCVKRTGISLFVTEQRLKLSLTQKQFAEYSGISLGAIRDIERGRYKLTMGMLHRLSLAFMCQIPAELILECVGNRDVKKHKCENFQTLIKRVKKMTGISSDNDVIYKALSTLKLLLVKQKKGELSEELELLL